MLCGFAPFYAEDNTDLFNLIKKGEFEFHSPDWDNVSDNAKDLIKKLLILDPKKDILDLVKESQDFILSNNENKINQIDEMLNCTNYTYDYIKEETLRRQKEEELQKEMENEKNKDKKSNIFINKINKSGRNKNNNFLNDESNIEITEGALKIIAVLLLIFSLSFKY